MTKKIDAWHFIPANRQLAHQGGLLVEAGFTYTEYGPIKICSTGLHASRTVRQALIYAPSSILCRVRSYGEVVEQSDKLVSRHRDVVAIQDVKTELALWACWCVRQTPVGDGRVVWDLLTDKRSRNAIEVTEQFARGEATSEQVLTATAKAAANAAATAKAAANANAAATAAANAAAYAAAAYAYATTATAFQSEELERRMLALFEAKS